MSRKNSEKMFREELNTLKTMPEIRQMQNYAQHRGNTTYKHCVDVAEKSFAIAEKLHLDISEKELARGAMLHDFYLYGTDTMEKSAYRHGVSHPEEALNNARELFDLSEREENIIRSHMWPLTLFHVPKYREAVLVSMADKYCASVEMLHMREMRARVRKMMRRFKTAG